MAAELRAGGTRLQVYNSGHEVWLYDDAHREAIRNANPPDGMGGMPANFEEHTRAGRVVGYSLQSDDQLDVMVYVGAPFTATELAAVPWLEPQTALLRMPSGTLCLESNDASRIGFEEPTEQGAQMTVPPGDYRVTLYRVDAEALWRAAREWEGPQEVIVLTPGGTAADAADDLLPHESRRDTSWVGKYEITGRRAKALVWLPDYWDTFTLNLDATALERLGVAPGSFLKTVVPAAGLTFISTFAKSWADAEKLPPPAGVPQDEYGYATLLQFQEWNGAEGLFCKRATTKKRVEQQLHYLWTPAEVEVLDVKPEELKGRVFSATNLSAKQYFDDDFLTMVLSDVLPQTAQRDELPLADALDVMDEELEERGLKPVGDQTWRERIEARPVETSCRLYAGLDDRFAAILVREGSFEIVFLTEMDNGNWVATGFADEIDRFIGTKGPTGLPVPNPRVRFATMDESLDNIFEAHDAALGEDVAGRKPAPRNLKECGAAFGRFLEVAFGAQ